MSIFDHGKETQPKKIDLADVIPLESKRPDQDPDEEFDTNEFDTISHLQLVKSEPVISADSASELPADANIGERLLDRIGTVKVIGGVTLGAFGISVVSNIVRNI